MQKKKTLVNPLRKVLGVAFGLAVVVGSTIGVGILRTPASIAALVPDARIIIACWIAIGFYIILSASSYAELTTMLPKAGGAYNYIKRAFGGYAGFLNGWFDLISNAMAPAYFCIVLSEYCVIIFPQLENYRTIFALFFLTLFTGINFPGIRSGSIIQKVTSAMKVILFMILIGGCFFSDRQNMDSVTPKLMAGSFLISLFKALQLIMGSYDGWMSVSFFAEEDSNPNRNIPKSYIYGALTIAILYVLINSAILYALPIAKVATSPLAASDAAAAAFGTWSSVFMTVVAIFSLISILNAYMMIPSRILFGLSRDGFFFHHGTFVNKGGTPYVSLLICYAFAFILIVFSSFERLFSLGAFMMVIVTGSAFASLIRLRIKEPEMHRPYLAWGYPFTTWLALLVTIALFIGFAVSDVVSLVIVLGVVVVSYVFYSLILNRTKLRQ